MSAGDRPRGTPPADGAGRLDRREFIRRVGLTTGLAAAASYLALAPPRWPLSLRDPDGRRALRPEPPRRLPEGGFAVAPPAGAAALGVARGEKWREMIRAAVDAIGGLGHYVRPGDVVVVKPNVAFGRAPALGATTNPEVLAALVELLREAGAREVRVADNPIESPRACFEKTGLARAAAAAGARVMVPGPRSFEDLATPGAALIPRWPFFWEPFRGADKVIGLAPVKDHNLAGASLAAKNWYGLLGGRRNQFHQDIHAIIADLVQMMRPTFILLDGSRVLLRNGPTGGSLGDVVAGRTIVAARDALVADAWAWTGLLGRTDPPPAYLEVARARGLGDPDWRRQPLREVQVG